MQIAHLLDSLLMPTFYVLTLFGAIVSIHVMQATSHYHEDRGDPLALQWAHRATLVALALTLLWMLTYARNKEWEPWPPVVVLLFVVDSGLVIRGVILHYARANLLPRRFRREGVGGAPIRTP